MNFYIYKISEVALTVKGVPLTNLHQNKSFHQIPESYSSEKFPLYWQQKIHTCITFQEVLCWIVTRLCSPNFVKLLFYREFTSILFTFRKSCINFFTWEPKNANFIFPFKYSAIWYFHHQVYFIVNHYGII